MADRQSGKGSHFWLPSPNHVRKTVVAPGILRTHSVESASGSPGFTHRKLGITANQGDLNLKSRELHPRRRDLSASLRNRSRRNARIEGRRPKSSPQPLPGPPRRTIKTHAVRHACRLRIEVGHSPNMIKQKERGDASCFSASSEFFEGLC